MGLFDNRLKKIAECVAKNLQPSLNDMNTNNIQTTQAYIDQMINQNPLLQKWDGDCNFRNENNYDKIKQGMIPNKLYFMKFNRYLDAIIYYFIEKINVEHSKLTADQWQTAYNMMYNLFYFGRIIVRYNSEQKVYESMLPVEIHLDEYSRFTQGSGIHIGAINNAYGVITGMDFKDGEKPNKKWAEPYKNYKVKNDQYALAVINKWGLGFIHTLREQILTTIYFENKTEHVGLLETVKAYEKVSNLNIDGYFENQIKSEDHIVVRKLADSKAMSEKLEIIDFQTGGKLQDLTSYIDWRDARLSTWLGMIENQVKNKKANLVVAEVEGVQDMQLMRFEHYYDAVKLCFQKCKELNPDSPIVIEEFQKKKEQEQEQEQENKLVNMTEGENQKIVEPKDDK